MDLLLASIIISIIYLIAIIIGACYLHSETGSIIVAVCMAWFMMPGGCAILLPCLAHIKSELF